ncbi:hypothetical protein B6D52_03150 [Candidatus Parcubacteria bacterium 4484_255]|nr:MAG: hypothetical protein B6D52_03150 [Candidatus Parcubacteria bacterium 4484_255]
MKNNTVWIIIIVVVLAVLGVILLVSKPEVAPEKFVGPKNRQEKVVVPEDEGKKTVKPLEETKVVVPGASPVSKKGQVLTPSGNPVDNAALPGSPDAPKQSRSLSQGDIPKESIKLTVSASGFEPSEFNVKSGDAITLCLTSTDKTHVLKFDDASLQAVAIGVAGNETKAITFNAPAPGDYTFYCDVPGHRLRGETGVMHVK